MKKKLLVPAIVLGLSNPAWSSESLSPAFSMFKQAFDKDCMQLYFQPTKITGFKYTPASHDERDRKKLGVEALNPLTKKNDFKSFYVNPNFKEEFAYFTVTASRPELPALTIAARSFYRNGYANPLMDFYRLGFIQDGKYTSLGDIFPAEPLAGDAKELVYLATLPMPTIPFDRQATDYRLRYALRAIFWNERSGKWLVVLSGNEFGTEIFFTKKASLEMSESIIRRGSKTGNNMADCRYGCLAPRFPYKYFKVDAFDGAVLVGKSRSLPHSKHFPAAFLVDPINKTVLPYNEELAEVGQSSSDFYDKAYMKSLGYVRADELLATVLLEEPGTRVEFNRPDKKIVRKVFAKKCELKTSLFTGYDHRGWNAIRTWYGIDEGVFPFFDLPYDVEKKDMVNPFKYVWPDYKLIGEN